MLSYQHSYHAGNPADLHKHGALAALIALMTRKPRPITYVETHAGRGLYDLGSAEALKTGEAALGVLATPPPPGPYADAIAATRAAHGPQAYPGSPMVAAHGLRDADRMILMELHKAEHAALKQNLPGAEVHLRDGFEGVLGMAPLTPRKGLVLIDPSYEIKTDYARTADFTRALIAKWPEVSVMIWYPILPEGRHEGLIDGLKLHHLRDEIAFPQKDGRGMMGSGLALANAPYGAKAIFRR